jgi:hypothetical protein
MCSGARRSWRIRCGWGMRPTCVGTPPGTWIAPPSIAARQRGEWEHSSQKAHANREVARSRHSEEDRSIGQYTDHYQQKEYCTIQVIPSLGRYHANALQSIPRNPQGHGPLRRQPAGSAPVSSSAMRAPPCDGYRDGLSAPDFLPGSASLLPSSRELPKPDLQVASYGHRYLQRVTCDLLLVTDDCK